MTKRVMGSVRAELLKMKHTFLIPFHVAMPVIIAGFMLFYYRGTIGNPMGQTMAYFELIGIGLPFVVSIVCAGNIGLEEQNHFQVFLGNYKVKGKGFVVKGVTDFYATVNYRKNMIKSYFTDTAKDYEIQYVEENQPLGTAGSLRLIEEDFEQPFIVTNCDILIHADYEDVYRYHRESGNELTIVSALKNIVVPYGVIHSSENGAVQSMEEKPKLSYFVNTGMYILNPELKKEIPENTFYHMTDLTDKLLKENRKVGMYPISEDSFLDMGEFEEMHRMEKKLDLKSE